MRFLVFLFLACLIVMPQAIAQDAAPASDRKADRVQLVEDDEQGTLRIVIDGKEVGRIDQDGLHINGNLTYTGMQADVGNKPEQ